MSELLIIQDDQLESYLKQVDQDLQLKYDKLEESEVTFKDFSFYISVSAVYSSKIEGEDIDLDSYIKHKKYKQSYKPNYTKKIDDLYNSYLFAQDHGLNKQNLVKLHSLITEHILPAKQHGIIRSNKMFVLNDDGKIEYVACQPEHLKKEMTKFWKDIDLLLSRELNIFEIFYFASMIHFVFVKIHPFNDGNGRTARLLEKWFLANKLNQKSWFIPSEKYYYENHQLYYRNLRAAGIEYEILDLNKIIPFLLMLPQSL